MLLLFAAAPAYSAIAGYMAAGVGTTVGGYFVVPYAYSEIRDWIDPSRLEKRNHSARLQREAEEWVKNNEQRLTVDIEGQEIELGQTVVEARLSLENINQTQSVLFNSTGSLTTTVDETAEGAQSMRQKILITEDELQLLRSSMRQQEEELARMNARLEQTYNLLAEKDVLLGQSLQELDETKVQLGQQVVELQKSEQAITNLSAQKDDEVDSEWNIIGSNMGSTGKVHQHDGKTEESNRMLVNATRQSELLAQENEALKNDNGKLNDNYQILTNKNKTLVDGKEMLMEKLLEAHQTIESLESKLEAASTSRQNQGSPTFFSN